MQKIGKIVLKKCKFCQYSYFINIYAWKCKLDGKKIDKNYSCNKYNSKKLIHDILYITIMFGD